MATSSVNLQWKNTDVCLDFYCECGMQGHFDGYILLDFTCGRCQKVYKLTSTPELELSENSTGHLTVIEDENPEESWT